RRPTRNRPRSRWTPMVKSSRRRPVARRRRIDLGGHPAGGVGASPRPSGRDHARHRPPPNPGGAVMSIRILSVEDELALADFLVRGLREEGFLVEHAADGESARDAMQSGTWDLIVLDWWLPGVDGLTLLRRLRHSGESAPVL